MLKHKNWVLPKIPCDTPKKKDKKDPFEGLFRDIENNLYERLQAHRLEEWRSTVLAYESNPDSTYNAYYYVSLHPIFYRFQPWKGNNKVPPIHERHLINGEGWLRCVTIDPHMINPATNRIDNDPHLNTKQEWWIEFGPTLFEHSMGAISGHDWKRDCGAATYDEAILKVARLIHKHYGNDRRKVVQNWNDVELPTCNG